jgi:hypothetical protein
LPQAFAAIFFFFNKMAAAAFPPTAFPDIPDIPHIRRFFASHTFLACFQPKLLPLIFPLIHPKPFFHYKTLNFRERHKHKNGREH